MGIERGIMTDRTKNLIGVVGIGSGAGATLVASGLATVLARGEGGAAYVQEGDIGRLRGCEQFKPFDQLSLQTVFGKKKMYDLFHLHREGIDIEGRANLYNRVNWVVNVPGEYRKPVKNQGFQSEKNENLRLPYHKIGGRNIVVDTPNDISEMDKLVCVIDPLPSKIKSAIDIFTHLKEVEKTGTKGHILWVINKYNSYVNQKQLEKFLQIKADYILEMIEPEVFYQAEYAEIMPMSDSEWKTGFGKFRAFFDVLNEMGKTMEEASKY